MKLYIDVKFSHEINKSLRGVLFETKRWTAYMMRADSMIVALGAFEKMGSGSFRKNDILDRVQKQAIRWLPSHREILWNSWDDKEFLDQIFLWGQILDGVHPSELLTVPLKIELCGTPFQVEVWQALVTLKPGEVMTYGCIAEKIRPQGKRSYAQAVGKAIGSNPVAFFVPCHRIVGAVAKQGTFRWGMELRKHFLTLESSVLVETRSR